MSAPTAGDLVAHFSNLPADEPIGMDEVEAFFDQYEDDAS